MRWHHAGALVLLIMSGCSSAPSDARQHAAEAGVYTAMDSVMARFARAYHLGEPDSIVVLFTDAPLYLPGRGGILRGLEQLREQFAFLSQLREAGRVAHIRFERVERGTSGDLAFEIGYYHLEVEFMNGARSPPSRGKFATIWRRGADGEWRIQVDSFSPAPLEP